MMKQLMIFVFSLLLGALAFGQPSWPRVLLISDIDDTIKTSHVLDKVEVLVNGVRSDNVLLGMPQLYHLLLNRNPNLDVIYLTNALEKISGGVHAKLLEKGQFPSGDLILRQSSKDNDHKIRALRELAQTHRPDAMILFGDNGERDPVIYDQFRREFPRIKMLTFIRQMYSSQDPKRTGAALQPGQIGFVTPIEPVLDLVKFQSLTSQDLQWMIGAILPELLRRAESEDRYGRRGGLFMPRWQDCRDFVWGQRGVFALRAPGLEALKARLQARCSKPPLFDK